MTDWIKCNKCSLSSQPNIKLYVNGCGHLFCGRCVEYIRAAQKCIVCGKSASSLIPISNDMDFSVKQFFMPYEITLKKTAEIARFQENHYNRALQTLRAKCEYAKNEYAKLHKAQINLNKQNQLLRSSLSQYHKQVQNLQPGFLTSTPAITSDGGSPLQANKSVFFTPSSSIQSIFRNDSGSTYKYSPVQMVPGQQARIFLPQVHGNQISNVEQLRRVPLSTNSKVELRRSSVSTNTNPHFRRGFS